MNRPAFFCAGVPMTKKTQQFRIAELLIIIAVISFAGYSFAPHITKADNDENLAMMIAMLGQVRSQIDFYHARFDRSPDANSDTELLIELNKCSSRSVPCMSRLPRNPFNKKRSVRIDTDSNYVSGLYGWHYNPKTGYFRADNCPAHANL